MPVDVWHSIELISHPRIRDFAAYWDAKRNQRRAPSRRDLDPVDIPSFLPHIFMFDVVEPMRFKVRLFGTDVVARYGRDVTGRFIDEVAPPDHYTETLQELADVVSNFVLRYRIADLSWMDRPYARYHCLFMPLSDDQQRVNIVLGIAYTIMPDDAGIPTAPLNAAIRTAPVLDARITMEQPTE